VKNAPGNPLNHTPAKRRARKAASRRAGPARAGRDASSAAATETAGGLDAAGQVAGALPPEGTDARRQRDAVEAVKAKREPADDDDDQGDAHAAPLRLEVGQAGSSGAGFVLGALVWVAAVNFIQGGTPQVRKLLRAKFLNRTD
jgi:hypothetical protein